MILLPLFLFVGFFASIVVLGRWILSPIDRAAKARQAPIRYSIADFLCLFIIMQIPLAALHHIPKNNEAERKVYWCLVGLTWIMVPLIWFAATRALSKAGIAKGLHRWSFLGLVVPLTYYGLLPFVVMSLMAVGALADPSAPTNFYDPWFIAIWAALGSGLLLSGVHTRWLVRSVAVDDDLNLPKPDEA